MCKVFLMQNNLVFIENTDVCYIEHLCRLEIRSWAWLNTMNKQKLCHWIIIHYLGFMDTVNVSIYKEFVLCVTFSSTLYLCKRFIMWMLEIFKFPRWFYHFLKNICSHFFSVGFDFYASCLWENHDQGTKYYLCANEVTGIFWGQDFRLILL